MKTVTLLAITTFIVEITGFLIKVPTTPARSYLGPVGWVHLEKLILPLFENVCEASTNPIIVRLAQEFDIDATTTVYLRPEVTTTLKQFITNGLLPKGQIFTDHDVEHVDELKALYDVFFYAKDFDTFYKAASWARQNVNCGLFVRAIYLAILNRRDTEKLSVPAPYELLPNYFIKNDIILKASGLLSGDDIIISETVRDEGNSYVLDANYTADFIDNYDESKLAYFHEDIGLNTYYFLQKLKRSFWFNVSPDMSVRYGEYLYHVMKQLAARYDIERYANNVPELGFIDLLTFRADPYDPMLIYSNGKEFGFRRTSLEISNANNIEMLKTIESNIASIAIHMKDTGYNKTQILNHVMEILVTEESSFETLFRTSVGYDSGYDKSQPSVLDHYLTTVRDPIFWRINKKIVDLVDKALTELPGYTRNELYFPGIEVLNVDIKKMMTNFDYFQFDVTDALKTDATNTAFQVKIGQPRLNHKPFVLKLNISSLVSQKGLVKLFLGPKIAPGELALKKNLFMLLDSFECNLKLGSNVISRSSEQMENFSEDFNSLRTLHKNVEDAEFGLDSLPFKNIESLFAFPRRLMLPKGTPDGLPIQIFVIVAPYVKPSFNGILSIANVEFNSAIMSPGYPFDLSVDSTQLLNIPNTFIKDVVITHKGDKVTNFGGSGVTKKWSKGGKEYDPESKGSYNPTSRGIYDAASKPTYSNKEPFDYNAKKEQYGRKEGSFVKKNDYASKQEYLKSKYTTTTDPSSTTKESNDMSEFRENDKQYDNTDEIEENATRLELKKDNFLENYEKNVIEMEPLADDISDSEKYSALVRKPTIYDYIASTDDYYDEYDHNVYER